MIVKIRLCSLSALLFISIFVLCGCNNFEPHQDPQVARVLVTREPTLHVRATGYVPMILPYSLIEEQTYENEIYENFYLSIPKKYTPKPEDRCKERCFADVAAQRILANWRLVDALQYPFDTPHPYVTNGGMDVQIWVTRGKNCGMAVIAFRGTDQGDRKDLIANLHWFGRLIGVKDEYKQIATSITALTDRIKGLPCYSPQTEIIAVGHSLGGGLAQHVNHIDPSIDSVIVFDPSFVTGSWEVPKKQRDRLAIHEVVTRVYEHGEILAYPRFILRNIAPPPEHDPRVESIRFNVLEGNIVRQHMLRVFNTCLLNYTASGSTSLPVEENAPNHQICNYRE